MTSQLVCSFCGAAQRTVKKLIAGPKVYICDQCVEQCNVAMGEGDTSAEPLAPLLPSELLALLDAAIVGRRRAKRALTAALRRQDLEIALQPPARARAPRVLLVGSRGTGKTALGRALVGSAARAARVVDVARLSESGYVGDDVETFVYGVLDAADHQIERARRGLLFLDGLEKLRGRQPIAPQSRDINGVGAQRELVRLLDGEVVSVSPTGGPRHPQQTGVDVDTSGIVIVATFRAEGWEPDPSAGESTLRDALVRDGMIDAVLSRFDRVVVLPPLDATELAAILGAPGGPLDEANATITRLGGSLELDHEALAVMSNAAAKSGDGAWALRPIVRRLLDEILLSPRPAGHWKFTEADARRWTA